MATLKTALIWYWPDIDALIAHRSLLIAFGSEDVLWRPYGYRDVAHRIARQYAALGADDRFDLVEDLTPHGYTPKLRGAIFTWFNRRSPANSSSASQVRTLPQTGISSARGSSR